MNDKQKNRKVDWFIRLTAIIVASFVSLVSFMFSKEQSSFSNNGKNECVEKTTLKKDISIVIKSGGDLAAVTNTYNNRIVEKTEIRGGLYYDNKDLTLSKVLEDLRSDYFHDSVPQNKIDTLYVNSVNSILDEFSRNNPFEELEPDQRIYFQNVQTRLPDEYDLIKEDMMHISNALKDKNALTKEYLQKSTISFWISIAAVIITLALGLVQIFQNNSKAKEDTIVYNKILNQLEEKKE